MFVFSEARLKSNKEAPSVQARTRVELVFTERGMLISGIASQHWLTREPNPGRIKAGYVLSIGRQSAYAGFPNTVV